jgi:hypothetical protein
MNERISIIDQIRSSGFEASLITTFNAYLPFYEDVVLRHLMGSGVRHNVLLMDASQAALAVDRHPPRSAGRYYTLAPIKVNGAFHPKVILLVGKRKGMLLVGSHNLTLSGFGYNREMSNLIQYHGQDDFEAAAIINSAWQNVIGWAESQAESLPGHILDMVKKVQDFAPWLKDSAGTFSNDCRVLSAGPDAPTLWQQMVDFTAAGPVKRVVVSGAFFDANLSFLERVRSDLSPTELIVGIDPATVQFPVGKELPGVSFVNCAGLGPAEKDDKHSGYLHAKSLLIEQEDGEMVLAVGSANPSYPAWLAPGVSQNVEMMIARKGKDAEVAAEELGLLAIASMSPLSEQEWAVAKRNWEREDEPGINDAAAQIVIALATDNDIRFRVPGVTFPPVLDCEIAATFEGLPLKRLANLAGSEYILSTEDINAVATFFRFKIGDKCFTGLIQYSKQIEGLSRTGSQRKFNEALASLTTGMPNIEHFVECIKDIIKISDKVAVTRPAPAMSLQGYSDKTAGQKEGAELSIGLDEVVERNHPRKQRLRASDDLGYLLDVLLYNLRDESPIGLDVAMEERDAKGRSEEEQVDADDEEEILLTQPVPDDQSPPVATDRGTLAVCHYKVGSLVSTACDKLEALKQNKLEMPQFIVIMAGILSALRLLRGLDGKVPWIGAGQTAVPRKELRKLFNKIVEIIFDGDKSIICLENSFIQLKDADEFARLKGLIIWLAWESGIALTRRKPFNESAEERTARLGANRYFVATAQLIAGDEDVISEARQSIGQFSSIDMEWLEKLLSVDNLFRSSYADSDTLHNGSAAKSGDFGFNSMKPECGVREVLPTEGNTRSLARHDSEHPRYKFQATIIRTIPFEQIFNATRLSS